jgi:hypothetical protein
VYNIPPGDFHAQQFDTIYVEGGLYWGSGLSATAKVNLDLLKSFVRQGGIAIVADVARNEANPKQDQSPYSSARDLFGTAPNWGATGDELRCIVDALNCLDQPSAVIAYPAEMIVERWLEPVYVGIDRLLVLEPLALDVGGASILGTMNSASSEVLARDTLVDAPSPFMFACVRQIGLGYIVLIAGKVSGDFVVENCPDNARWISNLIRHLCDEAGRERQRRQPSGVRNRSPALPDDEWATELGKLATDHNLIERRLRQLVAHRLSIEETRRESPGWAANRARTSIAAARQNSVDGDVIDELLAKMYWLELVAAVSKDWPLFENVFSDKRTFQGKADILNDRPYAHAKSIDAADIGLYRRELGWFKSKLARAD